MTYLSELQEDIGQTNEKSGFNQGKDVPEEYRNLYYSTKLLLINGEVTEASDEIRAGRDVNEVYYSEVSDSPLPKPEGAPTELADVVIRAFGIAYEAGIDLDAAIHEKLQFNKSRAFRHGGKKF